jgi:hypothetical protein
VPFSCGVIHHHPDSPFAKGGWNWPLSRVDLREGGLLAYTPVLFGRWTLNVPYVEINDAVLCSYRWGGKIRLHRTTGDVTITTLGGSFVTIADLLRDKGVHVTRERDVSSDPPRAVS